MLNNTTIFLTLLALSADFGFTLVAHPGRTDASGCHTNRKTGDYHCHNSGRTAPEKKKISKPLIANSMATSGKAEEENYLIYFDYDSYILTPANSDRVRALASWLKKKPKTTIRLEGHTALDEGELEYCLALGDRRVQAVKSLLVESGIDPAAIGTISYGNSANEKGKYMSKVSNTILE